MSLTKEEYTVYSAWEEKLAKEGLALFQVNSRLVSLDDNCVGCPEDFHELELHRRLYQGLIPKRALTSSLGVYDPLTSPLKDSGADLLLTEQELMQKHFEIETRKKAQREERQETPNNHQRHHIWKERGVPRMSFRTIAEFMYI
jgi:hypothetical protein